VIDCLYRRLPPADGVAAFASTDGTRSNWDPAIQHGSPPLALLTRAIEELAEGRGLRIGRLTLDILGAIPVAPVRVSAQVDRPGSRIALMSAQMAAERPDGSWRAVARVTAWLLATSDTSDAVTDRFAPLVEGDLSGVTHPWEDAGGYLETVSWRRQADDGSSAVVWLRPLVPLVDDDPTTPLQRLAMVVDSANGVGAALDPQHFVFMTPTPRCTCTACRRARTSRCGRGRRSVRTVSG
jgi:hypothetical protein